MIPMVMQVVVTLRMPIQRDDDDIQDWDAIVLNHVLTNVLDKDRVYASATNDFTAFVKVW